MNFDDFFKAATGNTPYDYQSRLADGDSGTACGSQLINILTGLGKTVATTLAWLWNRSTLLLSDEPHFNVYRLPTRTLADKTNQRRNCLTFKPDKSHT
jgi:CRISPR-associated endonuclease/helicase Cas3